MSFVLAITGPAGSGKSTVSKKLAKNSEKCVNIEADQVKHFIVSGFSTEITPSGNKKWNFNQWELLGNSIGLLASNFQTSGYNVIINGYIDPIAWKDIEKHIKLTHKILLMPSLDTVIKRDAGRVGDDKMGIEAVNEHYSHFSTNNFYDNFTKLDSTDNSTDNTVNTLLDIIKRN